MSTSAPLALEPDLTSFVLLADKLDESKVTPGVLGFLVFAVLGLAVWALMRSMTSRVNAVRGRQFDDPSGPGAAPGEAEERPQGKS